MAARTRHARLCERMPSLSHSSSQPLALSVLSGVAEVPAADWDALVDANDPFLEHAFLAALERSGSVGPGTGWEPRILVARQGAELVGAVPLYLKDDSMGEFIWDFAWAQGSHSAGIPYYPKLVAAVPFTPASGQRLMVHPKADRTRVASALAKGLFDVAEDTEALSIHVLFCQEDELAALLPEGFMARASHQFHWTNRPSPYPSFDDYLGEFRSRMRKQVRHERAVVDGYGLRIVTLPGNELDDQAWHALDRFYRSTVDRYGNVASLTPAFFHEIRRTHADRLLAVLAYRGDDPIAGTINFARGNRVCGRYWGSALNLPMVHFELCFYRLIEHAIANGLATFEGGAGGEQKLARGLLPRRTYSAHWIRHRGLSHAVGDYIAHEARAVELEMSACLDHSPFARAQRSL
jgi:predicted N-acyltransferase